MVKVAWMFAALGLCAACGAGTDPATAGATSGSGEGGSGDGGDSSQSNGSGGSDDVGVSVGTSSTGAGGSQIAEVYGHSASTLYRLDLATNQVGIVGAFTGCDDQVIDIALDKDSVLYGTTLNRPDPDTGVPSGGLWRIDRVTAACELISRGDFPNSLSFVPAGTLDSQQETLVGYLRADYVRINTQTGAVTTVRANALDGGLESSGDIVSVIDGPTYLTVKGDTTCSDTDCVIEVDPATGAAIGNLGSSGYGSVFGVAFWAGKVYGFTSAGEIFEFFQEEDGSISTNPIPASVDQFYGAGSTTAAPPTDVPN